MLRLGSSGVTTNTLSVHSLGISLVSIPIGVDVHSRPGSSFAMTFHQLLSNGVGCVLQALFQLLHSVSAGFLRSVSRGARSGETGIHGSGLCSFLAYVPHHVRPHRASQCKWPKARTKEAAQLRPNGPFLRGCWQSSAFAREEGGCSEEHLQFSAPGPYTWTASGVLDRIWFDPTETGPRSIPASSSSPALCQAPLA